MRVRLTQLVHDLSDPDDRVDLPAGPDGQMSVRYYDVPSCLDGAPDDSILDWFHLNIAIGCLDDFSWEVVQ